MHYRSDLLSPVRKAVWWCSGTVYLAIVALAPLPFGLTAPLPIALCCIALAFSLVTARVPALTRGHFAAIAAIIGSVSAYIAVALIQISPEAASWARPAAIWAEAGAAGYSMPPLISWTKQTPWHALGGALLLTLSLLRATLLSVDPRQGTRLLQVVAISGVLYAVYGIAAHALSPTMLLWRPKTAYLDAATGPYVNRNTAAIYWGTCAILCCLFALDASERLHRSSRHRTSLIISILGCAICVIAIAMTGSRAGAALTFMALLTSVGLWYLNHGWARWTRAKYVMIGLGLLLVIPMIGAPIMERIRQYGFGDQRRIDTYVATLQMIADHPWWGIGLGNFEHVFPRYRPVSIGSISVWDRVHSTPLEIAVEIGLPVTIIILSCCLILGYALLTGCLRRRRDRIMPISGLCVGLLGVGHSSVDFSLQIPGYAVVFAAVVGCGLAQTFPDRTSARTTAPRGRNGQSRSEFEYASSHERPGAR